MKLYGLFKLQPANLSATNPPYQIDFFQGTYKKKLPFIFNKTTYAPACWREAINKVMAIFTILKYYAILALLFSNSIVSAQEIHWQHAIGGNGFDATTSISPTADRGCIMGGISDSDISGDKTENCWGHFDFWVIKLDSAGNIQWEKTIGGSNFDMLYAISPTVDGGYICGGYSESFISGNKTALNYGSKDYWIIKLDQAGNITWQTALGGNNDDILYSLSQTADGGYICGGSSKSNISGNKTENSLGDFDYWIVKLDSTGNIQWQNTIGGIDEDQLFSIAQSPDGGYLTGGWSFSGISGDKTENTMGFNDYWVLKLDSAGNILWQNTIGGSSYEELGSLTITADGGYVCGGHSFSDISGDKSDSSFGGYDYWILKFDSAGNFQWQKTLGGKYDDRLVNVSQTADGGFICGGYSNSPLSGNKTENRFGSLSDYWVIKLDLAGNIEWQNTIGGTGDERVGTISQTTDGDYICGGWSSSGISGEKTENNHGSDDCWIVKLTDKYNALTGIVYLDGNTNNLQDNGEPGISNLKITEQVTGRFAFSSSNGYFHVSVLDSGNYVIDPVSINYYNTLPITHSAIFTGINEIDSLNDFAYQPAGVFNDLCVSISPLGNFRSGFNASYLISYGNYGTTTLNGTIIFYPDTNISYLSANVTPVFASTDSIVWNVGLLAPFQTGSILVTVSVHAGLPLGTLIYCPVHIDPVAGDANTYCNDDSWGVYTIGSFDPNDIIVSDETLSTTQLSTSPFLDYLIRFQNTGNDTAFTVIIRNPTDSGKLDLNTIEFIASSQPASMRYINWESNLEFNFENILLPDSNVNEPMSHGFVRYRIKPKTTLQAGDSITGFAAIYFDFNNPVITNTAVTKIILPAAVAEPTSVIGQLTVYPNPADDQLVIRNIFFPEKENGILRIFDLFGREVYPPISSNQRSSIILNVTGLSKGIYFVQVKAKSKVLRSKFLKQ